MAEPEEGVLPLGVVAFTTMSTQRPLYRRDALNALGYPEGWRLTLSYRGKWVSSDMWSMAGRGALRGVGVLCVLACDPAPTSGEFASFIPIRFGIITHSTVTGERTDQAVLTVWLQLERRPSERFVRTFTDEVLRVPHYRGLGGALYPGKARGFYFQAAHVFGLEDDLPHDRDEMDWHEHVDHLCKVGGQELAHCHFARLRALRPVGESLATGGIQPQPVPSRDTELTRINLDGGQAYELEFEAHERTMMNRAESPIFLQSIGTHIEVASPLISQSGSDASITYPIVVQRKYAPEHLSFLARMRDADKPAPLGNGPEFQALLRILPPRRFRYITFGGVAISTFLVGIDKEALAAVPLSPAWLLVTKGCGALLLAWVTWYALRRLPVKL